MIEAEAIIIDFNLPLLPLNFPLNLPQLLLNLCLNSDCIMYIVVHFRVVLIY